METYHIGHDQEELSCVCLCMPFTLDGNIRSVISGSSSGILFAWPGRFEENCSPSSLFIDGAVRSIASCDNRVYCASNSSNTVQIYRLPKMDKDGIVWSFKQPVNHLVLNASGTRLLSGSSDFTIRFVNVNDATDHTDFDGHDGPVLSVALDPTEALVASSSGDGSIKIWNASDGTCLKTLDILPRTSQFSVEKPMVRLCWHPVSGKAIYVPCGDQVFVIDRGSWRVIDHIKDAHLNGNASLCRVSPDGEHLAIGCLEGALLIWNLRLRMPVYRLKTKKEQHICDMLWLRTEPHSLVYIDLMGGLGRFELSDLIPKLSSVPVIKAKQPEKQLSLISKPKRKPAVVKDNDDDDDDDNDLFAGLIDQYGNANEDALKDDDDDATDDGEVTNTQRARGRLIVDDDDDYGDDASYINESTGRSAVRSEMTNLDEEDLMRSGIVDDEASRSSDLGAIKASYAKMMDPVGERSTDTNDQSKMIYQPAPPSWKPIEPQLPFVCCSTPTSLPSRFMKWNSTGIIRQFDSDEDECIEVEFHDVSMHHPMTIDNESGRFCYGDISAEALLLAGVGSEVYKSSLRVVTFAGWDSSKQWEVEMPEEEEIETIALAIGWLAVATNSNLIRLFSVGGVQMAVFAVPGPVVTMTHCRRGQWLSVAWHSGMGTFDSDAIIVSIFKIGLPDFQKTIVYKAAEIQLPLSKGSTLTWLGFTELSSLCAGTSDGMLYLLEGATKIWHPILNLRLQVKGRSDTMWIVDVTENPAEAKCIYCKAATYPSPQPRPLTQTVPWKVPLCDMDVEKTSLEASLIQNRLLQSSLVRLAISLDEDEQGIELKRAELDCVLKLFVMACKSDRDMRALEIANLMPTSSAVQILINFASKTRKMNLAEKLNELAGRKAMQEVKDLGETNPHFCAEGATAFSEKKPRFSFMDVEKDLRYPQQSTTPLPSAIDVDNDPNSSIRGFCDKNGEMNGDSDGVNAADEFDISVASPLTPSSSRLDVSLTRVNPFKRSASSACLDGRATPGSSVFDEMPKVVISKFNRQISMDQNSASVGVGGSAKRMKRNQLTNDIPTISSKQAKLNITTTKTNERRSITIGDTSSLGGDTFNDHSQKENDNTEEQNKSSYTSPITGFGLWLEQENDSLSQDFEGDAIIASREFTLFALKRYRKLTKEERWEWDKKAMEISDLEKSDSTKFDTVRSNISKTALGRGGTPKQSVEDESQCLFSEGNSREDESKTGNHVDRKNMLSNFAFDG